MPGKTPGYPEEFKRDAVALVRSSDKNISEIARDLGVSAEGLRGWVKKDRAERGVEPTPGVDGVTPDGMSLEKIREIIGLLRG